MAREMALVLVLVAAALFQTAITETIALNTQGNQDQVSSGELNSKLDNLASKMETLASKMERLDSKMEIAQSSQETNAQQINALNSKLDTLTATTARLSTEHQNLQTSISDVECTDSATELLLDINSKLDTLTATTAELSQTVQTCISDVECTDSGEVVKLRSNNFPALFLGVSQGVGRIIHDGPFTQWKLVPGICGLQNTITFESVNNPGHYLRHRRLILYLETYDGTPLFRNDACFHPRHHRWFNGYTAFESVNARNYYIRHYYSRLKISRNVPSDRLLRVDSSFKIEAV